MRIRNSFVRLIVTHEDNLAHALTDYLRLPDEERRRCGEVVRRNCIEHLGRGTLAERLVELVWKD